MRAISIRQPWAWLLVHADEYPDPKRVENRTWATNVRGTVLIHLGRRFDRRGYDQIIAMRPASYGSACRREFRNGQGRGLGRSGRLPDEKRIAVVYGLRASMVSSSATRGVVA